MTQVFADDEQAGDMGILTHRAPIPMQATYRVPPVLGPAMTPGKGVRPIRCVGCSRDTLPRHDDGAPLCERCSELLASVESGMASPTSWAGMARTSRWLRRRSTVG
jgi:hypothetical protein